MKYQPISDSDRDFEKNFLKSAAETRYGNISKEAFEKMKKEADEFNDLVKIYNFAECCYALDDYMKTLYYITIGHFMSFRWIKSHEVMFKIAFEQVKQQAEEIKRQGFGYDSDQPIKFSYKFDSVKTSYDYMWRLKCDKEKTSLILIDYERAYSILSEDKHHIDVWHVYLIDKEVEDKLFYVVIYLDTYCETTDVIPPAGFELI